jgi:O-antigen/teichoic acid export membrane protein
VKRWFADGVFRAVVRNASYLGSAKLLGAPLSLIALACAGRGLTPLLFGVLMVIHTYASAAGALVKFQTWQFIVRYAAPAMHRGDKVHARDVISFALGLDLLSGLIGMVVAMAALPWLGVMFGIDRADLWLALLYCTLVPTMSAATATGVLRVLDRFDLMGAQQLVTPLLRAIGGAISYFGNLGFVGFVATWYLADILGDLVLWAMAARELRRHDMLDAFRPGLFGTARRIPEAWSFVWTTNLSHSLYAAWGPVSNLIVASILGPVAAGLYKIADTLMDSTSKPADVLSKGFYPEIMRLDAASKQPWRLGLRVGLLAGLMGLFVVLVILLGGKLLIGFIFGAKYLEAFDLLRLMAFSLVISMSTFPLESLLYMVGRQRAALVAQIGAAVAYLTLLALLTRTFGLEGAGIAYVLGTAVLAGFMLIPTLSSYRRRREAEPKLHREEIIA